MNPTNLSDEPKLQTKRVLMLIPSFLKTGIDVDVVNNRHPRMDYYALADELRARGNIVDLIDYAGLSGGVGGFRDIYLAFRGFQLSRSYDTIFCNSESIALPLGIMLKGLRRRPRVVGIGHRISTPKKTSLFTTWNAMNGVDLLFLYSSLQKSIGIQRLAIPSKKLKRIQFHADDMFFCPHPDGRPSVAPDAYKFQVCSAGLEWRDYPTLIAAARRLPDVHFHIAAASPWSKHVDETQHADVPQNVTVQKHGYESLRELYRNSHVCVAPLYETDFQAGITTILEAMACGLPVIATKTSGQTDAIIDKSNGLYVQPADIEAMYDKLKSLLHDEELRLELGRSARLWIEENASLDIWKRLIADSI